jgi:uncharacterized protein (DUF1697 family)
MPRFAAFLRAINVGGHTVTMDRLRRHCESLGFTGVETFIASGNVVFETRATSDAALEKKIETALRARLGYDVATFVRSGAELSRIAAYAPFPAPAIAAAKTLYVGLFAKPLDAPARRHVMACRTDDDDFHVQGREVYWLTRVGWGQTTVSTARLEKTLGRQCTWRNVNTIRKMAARHGAR